MFGISFGENKGYEGVEMSLDEYIRRKNIAGGINLMENRKKKEIIDKDELDQSLDEIIQQKKEPIEFKSQSSKRDKFARYEEDSSDDESDDRFDTNEDVVMSCDAEEAVKQENSSIVFAKKIEKMDHPDCCKFKHFSTVESKMGVRVRPQQWRLLKENLDRPIGGHRLTTCPLTETERYRRINSGRIDKSYKQNPQNVITGAFVEKGNFTYKFGNKSNANDVLGITRNRPFHRRFIPNRQYNQNQPNTPPININIDLNGLFKGMTDCVKSVSHTAVSTPSSNSNSSSPNRKNSAESELNLKLAAKDLFELLHKKKKSGLVQRIQCEEMDSSYESDSAAGAFLNASSGNGIDMNITPAQTNLPLNLRFA